MIYRKWSLLTGPMVILGGIMGTAVAVRVLFFENPYLKSEQMKQDSTPSNQIEWKGGEMCYG